jgi:hypothetical protein
LGLSGACIRSVSAFFAAYEFWINATADYPYETIAEAQYWWLTVDLPKEQKQLVARENAIRLFKLPLEL